VLVPGAGGVPLVFGPLARALPDGHPVYAVANHGLEQRGWPDWTVTSAARRHLRELRAVRPRGPYVLVGHSLGGLVALEMARRLRRAGQAVPLVALLDSHPPGRLHGDAKTGRDAPTLEEGRRWGCWAGSAR
jgi:thioesterase domain-containing protein